jgi:hypothetical protein
MGLRTMKKPEKIDKFDKPAYKTPKTYTRTGSMTVLESPSRIAKTLFYPNGRIEREEKPD